MSDCEPPTVQGQVVVNVKNAHPEWRNWHSGDEQTVDLVAVPGMRVHLTGTAVQLSDFLSYALAEIRWPSDDIPPHPRVDVVSHRWGPETSSYVDVMDQAGDHQHRDIEGM